LGIYFILIGIGLIKEKSKNNNNEEIYLDAVKNKKYILNSILIILIGIFISISFLIIFSYITVFLIIISIPLKFVPLKYYFGVLNFK